MNNRLVISIENVRIKGGINKLNEPIETMDRIMEAMFNDANELAQTIVKHFAGNKGQQYEFIAKHAKDLAKALDESSIQMNSMQKQIVEFQIKTNRFNDTHLSVGTIRKRNVIEINPNVSTQETYFEIDTIKLVHAKFVDFSKKTEANIKKLVSEKDSIKSFWDDPQYRRFSDFINDIANLVRKYLFIFNKYADYLHGKIVEYNRG